MVRSEVMRGRFRNSFSNPEPFVPNEKTAVNIKLQDVFHTIKERTQAAGTSAKHVVSFNRFKSTNLCGEHF